MNLSFPICKMGIIMNLLPRSMKIKSDYVWRSKPAGQEMKPQGFGGLGAFFYPQMEKPWHRAQYNEDLKCLKKSQVVRV